MHLEGYAVPMFDEVSFEEYAGRKSDGSLNSQWKSKPGTMIRKVAIVHALREAFPEDLQGLYDASEMGVEQPVSAPVADAYEEVAAWEGICEEEYDALQAVVEVEAI